ncbi:MAG: hypothetical protein Q7S08_02790 [bacterium]|nr:hypothetical protein [bacterium]
MRAHFLKEKIAMLLRKFTLFVDRSMVGTVEADPKAGPAYMKISEFVGDICRFAAVYEGMSPEDRLKDHLPHDQDTAEIRSAFRMAYRIECVISAHNATHFRAGVKFYRRGEKVSFHFLYLWVRMCDGTTSWDLGRF